MTMIAYVIAIISLIASIIGLMYSIWINYIQRWLMRRRQNKVIQHLKAKEKYIEKQAKAND